MRAHRAKYSAREKRAVLEAAARPGGSVTAAAREHGIPPTLVFYWRRLMKAADRKGTPAPPDTGPMSAPHVLACSGAVSTENRHDFAKTF
jgi:transposase-like protein